MMKLNRAGVLKHAVFKNIILIILCSIIFSGQASFAAKIVRHKTYSEIKTEARMLKIANLVYTEAKDRGIKMRRPEVTVVNYAQPSTEKRLYVFNISHQKLVLNLRVAHGQKTGQLYAHRFSNNINSHETSLGLYLTAWTYQGHDGFSLKLYGEDGDLNDNAFKRGVIVHGAPYLTASYVIQHHEAGRSWGCFAVSKKKLKKLIKTIKDGTLVYAYYPGVLAA